MRDGHRCVAYDRTPAVVASLQAEGADGANSFEELVGKLDRPRNIWVMIPAGSCSLRWTRSSRCSTPTTS